MEWKNKNKVNIKWSQKGKEYFKKKLIFEGEYLNRKRQNGKLYNNGEILYIYLNGKKWNKKNK